MNAPKVAYLLKKFPRLSETFILNELLGIEHNGLKPRVFSRRTPDDEPRHPELSNLRAEVEVLPPARSVDPWTVLFGGPEHERAELLARLGEVVPAFRAYGHERLPSLLAEAIALLGRCRELEITHVHSHFATDSALVACLLHALGGPGYSLTLHAKDIYRSAVNNELLDRLVGDSRFSVTVCDANVSWIADRISAASCARLRRLYNGVDLTLHGYQSERRDAQHVLAVGRLVEKKGFDVLLRAVRRLRDAGRTLRVSLVGEGDQREALESQLRALRLGDTVELLGPIDQAGVRALMDRATLLALPCRVGADGNRDALPTVLLEALAHGLPCISTPVTGIPEILESGAAGVIVPENDDAALAEALAWLLDDSARREAFAVRGRARAEELFDVMANSARLREWFAESAVEVPARC